MKGSSDYAVHTRTHTHTHMLALWHALTLTTLYITIRTVHRGSLKQLPHCRPEQAFRVPGGTDT